MSVLTTVYATDEDVSVYAREDFQLLCPRDQVLADGTDGVFDAGNLWLLTSATADMAGQGVAAGNLCLLTKPISRFIPPGELLAVASVSVSGATLKRRVMATGVTGKPPAPAAGLTGVEFAFLTLFPQIEAVSFAINRILGLDDSGRGIPTSALFDARELREVCCYGVLAQRYLDCAHLCDDADTFKRKHDLFLSRYDLALASLSVRLTDASSQQTSVSRAGRIVR